MDINGDLSSAYIKVFIDLIGKQGFNGKDISSKGCTEIKRALAGLLHSSGIGSFEDREKLVHILYEWIDSNNCIYSNSLHDDFNREDIEYAYRANNKRLANRMKDFGIILPREYFEYRDDDEALI